MTSDALPTREMMADTAFLFRRINALTSALDRLTVDASLAAFTGDLSLLAGSVGDAAVALNTDPSDW